MARDHPFCLSGEKPSTSQMGLTVFVYPPRTSQDIRTWLPHQEPLGEAMGGCQGLLELCPELICPSCIHSIPQGLCSPFPTKGPGPAASRSYLPVTAALDPEDKERNGFCLPSHPLQGHFPSWSALPPSLPRENATFLRACCPYCHVHCPRGLCN